MTAFHILKFKPIIYCWNNVMQIDTPIFPTTGICRK